MLEMFTHSELEGMNSPFCAARVARSTAARQDRALKDRDDYAVSTLDETIRL